MIVYTDLSLVYMTVKIPFFTRLVFLTIPSGRTVLLSGLLTTSLISSAEICRSINMRYSAWCVNLNFTFLMIS